MRWKRTTYEKVCLKYLSQKATDEFINKDESYLTNELCYGISQNPDTKDYILVFKNDYFDNHCEKCDGKYKYSWNKWWEGDFTIAIWEDGPLNYCPSNYSALNRKYKRKSDEKVLLKYLSNSRNINNKFLNEIIYSIEKSYGISQDPNTKDYILVLQLRYYCEKCNKKYDNQFEISTKSCLSCQTNHEDKKINDFIQEMRLNIDHSLTKYRTMFEWIPYDRFDDIKEIGKGGFSMVYSAIWEDGLLDSRGKSWRRKPNTKVTLKCLHNSQNFPDEFINKVKAYPNIKMDNILKLYGISQNPDTKDYIMVLEYAEGGNFNNYLDKNYEKFDWFNGLKVLSDIFNGLSKIHQEYKVHCNFHMGNILFTKMDDNYNACISDMELCKKIDNINETSIYGVMPYVAPEVLKGKPYTQASNIYSFEMIKLFYDSLNQKFEKKEQQHSEIEEQFKETQKYRKENFSSHTNNKSTIHAQAIYTSRLLNPFAKNFSDDNTVEITDLTK
ncbi:kinase-like domain-containing protein [Rhizophagus clarus]|uniref:non-specific serine/threonine protein kinase n=1 Tax=Rhizophagus clarus TaxID=94130 RepID=A0A8H3MHV9_9GLOM|nr:kinase-like domain-containing protein [Rhizophagus clarus]